MIPASLTELTRKSLRPAPTWPIRPAGGNYIVFNGLTNDEILIVNEEVNGDWQSGMLFGFQIVVAPAMPIATVPTISPNPAYALSPVTLTEVASSLSSMTYQWQTDGGSGGSLTNIPGATASTVVDYPPDQGISYTHQLCLRGGQQLWLGDFFGRHSHCQCGLSTHPDQQYDSFDWRSDSFNIYAFAGGTVTLAAAFNGTQPITNQWQVDTGSGFTDTGPACDHQP